MSISNARTTIKLVILLFAFIGVLIAYPSPPPGFTGGFGEGTCVVCHSSFALDSGRDLGGDFYIDGVPDQYIPGQTYELTAFITHPDQSRWGFELAARSEDGAQAGTFELIDPVLTQIKVSGEIQYIMQTDEGTMRGVDTGPVTWTFNWTAPDADVGPVYFDASGMAANNDGGTRGDYVYSTEVVSVAAAEIEPSRLMNHNITANPR